CCWTWPVRSVASSSRPTRYSGPRQPSMPSRRSHTALLPKILFDERSNMAIPDEAENVNVVELDTAIRAGAPRRDAVEASSPVTAEAVRRLESVGEQRGRPELPPAYKGSFGRTLFDTTGSADGELTVVMHANEIEKVTSQALLR